jgi:hypothetical protein
MRKMMGAGAVALAVAIAAGAAAPLVAKDEPREAVANAPAIPPEMRALEKNLHPQKGAVRIPEAKAVLNLGESYYFLPAAEAKTVLTKVWATRPMPSTMSSAWCSRRTRRSSRMSGGR